MPISNQVKPRLKAAQVDVDYITLELEDGRIIMTPTAWFPRLVCASAADRQDFEVLAGRGIAWFRLGEDLTVDQVLKGQGSYESDTSFKQWQQQYTRGKITRPFPFLPVDAFDAAGDISVASVDRPLSEKNSLPSLETNNTPGVAYCQKSGFSGFSHE